MKVESFAEIEPEFRKRTDRIVWCTVATVDTRGRPRGRILHPIWDGQVGWIATGRHSLKEKHLANNPFVSLTYWDQQHEIVQVEARASFDDSQAAKDHMAALFAAAPSPLGYPLTMIWPGGANDPGLGALRIDPWRISLPSLADGSAGRTPMTWQLQG